MSKPPQKTKRVAPAAAPDYPGLVDGVSELLDSARRASVRAVNAFMTATYWEVGRRIVEFEQGGENRAEYGRKLIEHLSKDLTWRFGRGFGQRNVEGMRQFFLVFPTTLVQERLSSSAIPQTLSAELTSHISNPQTLSAELPAAGSPAPSAPFNLARLARAFPLPWSHYVLLINRSRSPEALAFYHAESLRAAGPCVNWHGRWTASSTNAPPSPATNPPCSPRGPDRSPATPSAPTMKSAIRSSAKPTPPCQTKKSSPPNWKRLANNWRHGNESETQPSPQTKWKRRLAA